MTIFVMILIMILQNLFHCLSNEKYCGGKYVKIYNIIRVNNYVSELMFGD